MLKHPTQEQKKNIILKKIKKFAAFLMSRWLVARSITWSREQAKKHILDIHEV